MYTTKVFLRKTKTGNIIKHVREHYLRDDIHCGLQSCEACLDKTTNQNLIPGQNIIILDTNIILDQIDILDEDALTHVIILETVYQEVQHRSLPVTKRLNSILNNSNRHFYVFANEHHMETYVAQEDSQSVNDYNDLLIRNACKFYQKHMPKMNIIFITDDVANRTISKQENIHAVSMFDHIKKSNINLEDKLSRKDFHHQDTKNIFPPHYTISAIHNQIKSGKILQGTFRASRENFLEGSVNVEGSAPILLQGRENLNRAVDGDIVAVELFPETEWSCPSELVLEDVNNEDAASEEVFGKIGAERKPTGRIVGIITRKWRQYCGIIQAGDDASVMQIFVPAEKKIPKIRIETRQTEFLKTQKIIVTIDSWPRHSRYPHGHFVRALGKIGDRATENEVLLLEHDVPHSRFSEQVLSFLPKMPWTITEEDLEERTDLRHLDICSVDPPGCTDIDDALHCRQLANGNMEIGVHIADVTHFIRPGTALDQEAASRATTVYLVDMRIDMVPELLSSNLCSLRGNQERFAFSCIWEMSPQADIKSTKFMKSVIKSRRAMTYEEAQLLIDDKTQNDCLSVSLRHLNNLAKHMKKRRMNNGALVLASPEIRFKVDDENDPIDVQTKQVFETNSMVEEFMLQANISVAEKILKEFPDCATLRRHPVPPLSNFEPLIKAARHLGFHLDTSSGKKLAESLDEAIKPDNLYFNTLLRILATRCMLQAVYFSSGMLQKDEYMHYGLAVPLYTHFTSPIRRYADILVHRLLAASIGADDIYPDLLDKRKMHDLCHNLNYRNRMAQYAGRASVALNTHMFFRGKVQEEKGYVLYVRKNALQILIPKFGLECTLYLPNTLFHYDEEEHTQKCAHIVFHAFDPVTIRLSLNSTNIQHEKISVDLVEPFIEGFSSAQLNASKKRKLK